MLTGPATSVSWIATLTLPAQVGSSSLVVVARDVAGNESRAVVAYTATPPDEVLLDAPLVLRGVPLWVGEEGLVDFDGDGIRDFLTHDWVNHEMDAATGLDEYGFARLLVWRGRGRGLFEQPYALGVSPPIPHTSARWALFADVNGDKVADLLFRANTGEVWVAPGRSGGGFATSYSLGFGADHLRLEDFDGDGDLDGLASSNLGLSVVENFGGTFATPVLVRSLERYGQFVSLGLMYRASGGRGVYYGVGNSSVVLGYPAASRWGDRPATSADRIGSGWVETDRTDLGAGATVFEADWNGDDQRDLLLQVGTSLVVLVRQGATLREAARRPMPPQQTLLAAGDFNGDKRADVLTARYHGQWLDLYRNETIGVSATPDARYPMPTDRYGRGIYQAARTKDLDGDGRAEVVGARRPTGLAIDVNATFVLLSRASSGLRFGRTWSDPSLGHRDIAVGDIDADQRDEVVVSVRGTRRDPVEYVTLEARGEALGETARTRAYDSPPHDQRVLGLYDVQPGASPELIAREFEDYPRRTDIIVRRVEPDASFGPPIRSSHDVFGSSPFSVLGDFDTDGNLDVFVGDRLALGRGDGTFLPSARPSYGCVPYLVVDLNGDRKNDLVGFVGFDSVWLEGDGRGGFSNAHPLPTGPALGSRVQVYAYTSGDFDGDGDVDLATVFVLSRTGWDATQLLVLLNDGTGSFSVSTRTTLFERGSRAYLVSADLNHDGRSELIATNPYEGVTLIAWPRSDGSFVVGPSRWDLSGSSHLSLSGAFQSLIDGPAVGDLEGDAFPEVLLLGNRDGRLHVASVRKD